MPTRQVLIFIVLGIFVGGLSEKICKSFRNCNRCYSGSYRCDAGCAVINGTSYCTCQCPFLCGNDSDCPKTPFKNHSAICDTTIRNFCIAKYRPYKNSDCLVNEYRCEKQYYPNGVPYGYNVYYYLRCKKDADCAGLQKNCDNYHPRAFAKCGITQGENTHLFCMCESIGSFKAD